ncbi:unnamed protein product [Prunus armeniaca]|uniref:Uncharacterized protein n=1 Tax=Prunus armeniaca TaxID=36596 RepID=A0A6J5Y959_PRUAR|nr:unnamed protein product [Prunus armeniaca]
MYSIGSVRKIFPFGSENIVAQFGKGFGEKVSHLINEGDEANPVIAQGHLFANEVIIELDMSCACEKPDWQPSKWQRDCYSEDGLGIGVGHQVQPKGMITKWFRHMHELRTGTKILYGGEKQWVAFWNTMR